MANSGGGPDEKPQFYIELDAATMKNIKEGTQYTLVPVDIEQGTAAGAAAVGTGASPRDDIPGQHNLTMDGKLSHESVNGNQTESVPKVEVELEGQTAMSGLDLPSLQTTKQEVPDTPPLVTEGMEGSSGGGSEKQMTYAPLISVPLPGHGHEDSRVATTAAAAVSPMAAGGPSAVVQMHHAAGYETLRYRHHSSPICVAPSPHVVQHQAPFLVHARGSWETFPGTAHPQAVMPAYLSSVMQPKTPNTPGDSSSSLSTGTSSLGGSDGSFQGVLAREDVSSPPEFGPHGDAGGNDLIGVAHAVNMGQIQHMVGPLDNIPYYMPFNGRGDHNEKERQRRTRIKNACQTLRSIVPGLTQKTDKATVFEFTVQYLLHLRRNLGAKDDMHHAAGYETIRYRHHSPPICVAPSPHGVPHQTPFLVHARGAWETFPGTAYPQGVMPAYPSSVMQPKASNTPNMPSCSSSSSSLSASTSSLAVSDGGFQGVLAREDVSSPPEFGRHGNAGGNELMGVAHAASMDQIQHMMGPLDNVPFYMPFNGRGNHNEKERHRRTRIKNACQTLRSIVPGLSEKTDKATVFEFTVQYLLHLRRNVGAKDDMALSQEFVERYSPY